MKLCWIIFVGLVGLVWSQSIKDRRCFHFTWVGPKFDNTTVMNHSCKKLTIIGDGACVNPMVVTDNSFPPNLREIWEKRNETLTCRLAKGQVCAKWTQYYEDAIEYQTYLCTKITVKDEGSFPLGCIENSTDSKRTELCACQSAVGTFPCNYAASPYMLYYLLIAAVLVTAYLT